MKPLAQMTFEEASKMRAALDAIAQVLDEAGIITLFDPNRPQKAKKEAKKAEPPKTTRNRKKGGHKEKCFNPGCTRGPGKTPKIYIKRRKAQRFCSPPCGQHYFTTIRSYARACVRADEERATKWVRNNKWLVQQQATNDVTRIIALESKLWRKEQDRIVKRQKHQKGTTILKNTPTASATS